MQHRADSMKKFVLILMVGLLMGGGLLTAAQKKSPRAAVGLKAAAFGIPNQILDLFIYEHPEINGQTYSFDIRSYGSRGPKSVFSGIYSLEYSKMTGEGPWRDEQEHRRLDGKGEITQLSLTATIIMNIFPSSPVHPYIGGGLGIGKISIWYEGTYTDELGTTIEDRYEDDRIIPVVHVPVGLIINLKNRAEIRIEGGFKNGFYAGAAVAINF
jgi:hypothetical protein